MSCKSFLPLITTWLSKRNKYVTDVYYCTLSNNAYIESQKAKYMDTIEIKSLSPQPSKKKKAKIKPMKRKKHKLIGETFSITNHTDNTNTDLVDIHQNNFKKTHSNLTNVLQLIDSETATKFVSLIMNDLSKNMCFVAELNPGNGILTKELLKAGVPCIHLYEAKKEFHPILNSLNDTYPDKLNIRKFNLLKISQLLYIDRITGGTQLQEVLHGIESKEWKDKTCMQLIGATSTPTFFRHLVYSLLFRNCLMQQGRPVFYMAIPPSLWHKYTCDNTNYSMYTTKKIMFQILFNYELLGELNRKAFIPLPKKSTKHNSSNNKYKDSDYDVMYVIKLEPKCDIYSQFLQQDWITFWYFIRHNMRKRCTRVIPELEKWVPGCGIKLIANRNYTIFTQFGELTPKELVELFKEFKSWPEYKTCNFLTSMNSSLSEFDEPALLELDTYEMQE